MIHSSLEHPNVVRMEDTFEDDEHVYFKLELCRAGVSPGAQTRRRWTYMLTDRHASISFPPRRAQSMNDMVKRRGRYHDCEARFFMVQILAGCQGMHTRNIIHRDLKLGNIFLDERMNVKIGDFGLAALLKEVGERKKTVCGTPNYIAPEILYDEGEGHSFEVDVWSVGVILYTMLVGKPPFQTSDVEKIYEKIRDNDYRIPPNAGVRPEAQDLITRILAPRPSDRPSLVQIMEHPWFTCAAIPTFIPLQATQQMPKLSLPTTWEENDRNFEIVKQRSQWDPHAEDLLEEDEYDGYDVDPREELRQQEALEQEREKMDKQFHRAIQPASPISALLKASRQPLVKTTMAAAGGRANEGSLARQLQALSIGRAQSQQNIASSAGAQGEREKTSKNIPERVAPPPPSSSGEPVDKENARPNAARNGGGGPAAAAGPPPRSATVASLMGPPPTMPPRRGAGAAQLGVPSSQPHEGDAEERRMLGQKARLVAGSAVARGSERPGTAVSVSSDEEEFTPVAPPSKAGMVDLMLHYLQEATKAAAVGVSYAPLDQTGAKVRQPSTSAVAPRRFIICWVDHSEKYGMGYALNDGSLGVHFRDTTNMSLNFRRDYCDYIPVPRRSSRIAAKAGGADGEVKRENFCLDGYTDSMDQRSTGSISPDELPFAVELHPKVKVLRYFEQELMDRLHGSESPLTFQDEKRTTEMTYVMRWWRTQFAMVFRLSSGVFQFNFYDHIKVFVSEDGLVVSFIPPVEMTGGVQQLRAYHLAELVSIAHHERSAREAEAAAKAKKAGVECKVRLTTPTERRIVRNIVKKLRQCREMLEMVNAGSSPPASRTGSATAAAAAAAPSSRPGSSRR